MNRLAWLAPLLVACTGASETDTDDTGPDVSGPPTFASLIDTTSSPVGDLSCYTAGDPWLTQQVDTSKQVSFPAVATVLDFQEDTPVTEATVDFWAGDAVTATPDATAVTDLSGQAPLPAITSCTPYTYKTWTDPGREETVDTFEAHQIDPYPAGASIATTLNSVSDSTYKIIPSLLGVEVQSGLGVIAGTAYDCAGNKIEHAEVLVHDGTGVETGIPDTLVVKYFVDKFPNRDQPDTSEDGLWTAINVPPGDWTVEMYVWNGTDHVLVGATVLTVKPDSINISNIYTGFGDGVKYPAECLLAG